jgi:hypothetical protein
VKEIFLEKVQVRESLESVWEYFINFDENGAKWMNGISNMKVKGGGVKKGSEIISYTRGKEITSTVTDFENHTRITLTSNQGNFNADYTYTFTKNGEFTDVALNAKLGAKGLSKVMIPLLKGIIKKTDGGQMVKLKERIEQHSITSI